MSKQKKYRNVEPVFVGTPFNFNVPPEGKTIITQDKKIIVDNSKPLIDARNTGTITEDNGQEYLTTYPEVTITAPRPKVVDKNLQRELTDEYEYSKLKQPYSIGKSPSELLNAQYLKDISEGLHSVITSPLEAIAGYGESAGKNFEGAYKNIVGAGTNFAKLLKGESDNILLPLTQAGLAGADTFFGALHLTSPAIMGAWHYGMQTANKLAEEYDKATDTKTGSKIMRYFNEPVDALLQLTDEQKAGMKPEERNIIDLMNIAVQLKLIKAGEKVIGAIRKIGGNPKPETKSETIEPEVVEQPNIKNKSIVNIRENQRARSIERANLKEVTKQINEIQKTKNATQNEFDKIELDKKLEPLREKRKEHLTKIKELSKQIKTIYEEAELKPEDLDEFNRTLPEPKTKGLLPEKIINEQPITPEDRTGIPESSNINFSTATRTGAISITGEQHFNDRVKSLKEQIRTTRDSGKRKQLAKELRDTIKNKEQIITQFESKTTPVVREPKVDDIYNNLVKLDKEAEKLQKKIDGLDPEIYQEEIDNLTKRLNKVNESREIHRAKLKEFGIGEDIGKEPTKIEPQVKQKEIEEIKSISPEIPTETGQGSIKKNEPTETMPQEKSVPKELIGETKLEPEKEIIPSEKDNIENRKNSLLKSIWADVEIATDKKRGMGERAKARARSIKTASALRQLGINANVLSDGGKWTLFVDDVRQTKSSLLGRKKVENVDLEEHANEITNPKATKPFEEMSKEDIDRQIIIAESLVEADDLPSGFGKKKLEKAIQDLKDDNGKELGPEAKILRNEVEYIANNGKRIRTVSGAKGAVEELSPEEINGFVKEQRIRKNDKLAEYEREVERLEYLIESEKNDIFGGDEAKIKEYEAELEKLKKNKPIFGEQESFENLAEAVVPEEGLYKNKVGKETETPLFEQKPEQKESLFDKKPTDIKVPNNANAVVVTFKDGKNAKVFKNDLDTLGNDLSKIEKIDFVSVSKNKNNRYEWENAKTIDSKTSENLEFKSKRVISDEKLNEAKNNISKAGRDAFNLGINPSIIKDWVTVGAYHIENGARTIGQFAKKMISEYGNKIRPHLRKIWDGIKQEFGKQLWNIAEKQGMIKGIVGGNPFETSKGKIELPKETLSREEKIVEETRKILLENKSIKDIEEHIRKNTFRNEIEQKRFEELNKLAIEERKGGRLLTADEKIELEKLQAGVDVNAFNLNALKLPVQVASKNPIVKAGYELGFEALRSSEKENIKLKRWKNDLIKKARDSRGKLRLHKYDEALINALSGNYEKVGNEFYTTLKNGEIVELTPEEIKAGTEFSKFAQETKPIMTEKTSITHYDFPHIKKGFMENWHYDGLPQAISKLFEGEKNEYKEDLLKQFTSTSNGVFNPFALKRIGRVDPTMDLSKRLDAYIDVYTLKKELGKVLPSINRLNQALMKSGLTNSAGWLRDYYDEISGKNFTQHEKVDKCISALNTFNVIRWLWGNTLGYVANFTGGEVQNISNMKISEYLIGKARLSSPKGIRILLDNNVIDIGDARAFVSTRGRIASGVKNAPTLGYSLGEAIIQGSFYLGKLTKAEFESEKISPQRDRAILEEKSKIQGGYHKGMRMAFLRTTTGKAVMPFRRWLPAVMSNTMEQGKASYDALKDILKGEKLTEKTKKDATGFAKKIMIAGSLIYLYYSELLDDETKKKVGELLNDSFGYFDPNNILYTLKTPIPALTTAYDLGTILYYGGQALVGEGKYKSDSKFGNKGEYKVFGKLKSIMPGQRMIFAERETKEKRELKELGLENSKEIQEINNLSDKINKLRKIVLEQNGRGAKKLYEMEQSLETKKYNSNDYQKLLEYRYTKKLQEKEKKDTIFNNWEE